MAGIYAQGRRIALRPKLHRPRRNRHGTSQRKRLRPGLAPGLTPLTPQLTPGLMLFAINKGPICDKLWLRGEWLPGEWHVRKRRQRAV